MHKKGCRCERSFANIGCCSKRFWDFAILNCSRGQTVFVTLHNFLDKPSDTGFESYVHGNGKKK